MTLAVGAGAALAADHNEAPGSRADPDADITDLYVWHQDGNIVAVIDWTGFGPPGAPGSFDRDVLFTLHIDTDLDNVSDQQVLVRFGEDSEGNIGVKVENLPGTSGDVVGGIEHVITEGRAKVFAGVRDDPFFFDFEGFSTTLDTGTLSFNAARDAFAGTNVSSVVLEFPAPTTQMKFWATSGRIGG